MLEPLGDGRFGGMEQAEMMSKNPDILRFSGGGTQYIDPLKDVRPRDSRSRAPGPPPPPKRGGFFTRWGRRIFYSIFAVIVIGGIIWAFTFRPDSRSLEQKDATATAEARGF